jgi:hypothetical protein
MRRRLGLTFELGFREAQRFQLPDLFRIYGRLGRAAALPFRLTFVDALLDPRICVDKSFSRITHTFKPTIIVCRAQTF